MPYEIEKTVAELTLTLRATGPDAQRPTEFLPYRPDVLIIVDEIEFVYVYQDGEGWDVLRASIAGQKVLVRGRRGVASYQACYAQAPAIGPEFPEWLMAMARERRPVGMVGVPPRVTRLDSS